LNAFYFLGIGAKQEPEGPNPLVTVGWASIIGGIVGLVQSTYIMVARPLDDASVVLAGLVAVYGGFFLLLGITEVLGLDLRQIGNLAIAVAIVPLFWWQFFEGGWMFRSILIVWAVAFLAIAATTYGKLPGRLLGFILLITAVYTFFVPPIMLALGYSIP
jgi:hypothetical protein